MDESTLAENEKRKSAVKDERTTPMDESIAMVKMAVDAHLNEELDKCTEKPKDDEKLRASRYVATVRPAMASQRYNRNVKNDDGGRHVEHDVEPATMSETDTPVTGEDDGGSNHERLTGEDGARRTESADGRGDANDNDNSEIVVRNMQPMRDVSWQNDGSAMATMKTRRRHT
eukprot:jgi/Phyca11/12905/fgenesh1_pg.PHYCAscaffold_2_\